MIQADRQKTVSQKQREVLSLLQSESSCCEPMGQKSELMEEENVRTSQTAGSLKCTVCVCQEVIHWRSLMTSLLMEAAVSFSLTYLVVRLKSHGRTCKPFRLTVIINMRLKQRENCWGWGLSSTVPTNHITDWQSDKWPHAWNKSRKRFLKSADQIVQAIIVCEIINDRFCWKQCHVITSDLQSRPEATPTPPSLPHSCSYCP